MVGMLDDVQGVAGNFSEQLDHRRLQPRTTRIMEQLKGVRQRPTTGVLGKIDAGYIFRDFARFFVSSDWPQCILRKDDRALVKFPSE